MITTRGEVRATMDGKTRVLGEIEIARFRNPSGLISVGDNLLAESAALGPPFIGIPGSGGMGILIQKSLQGSNVDLATEFVMEILSSIHFKTNLKTLKTLDEMLGSIPNIKT